VLLGIANAACHTAANLGVATDIPAHRRGLAFGVKQAAIPVAIALAGLAVPTLGTVLGWRATFLATGIAGLLLAVFGLLSGAGQRRPARTAHGLDRPPVRALLISMLAVLLASAVLTSLSAYVAPWAFEVGLTPAQAGMLIAVGSALNIIARLVGGYLADRRQGRNFPWVAAQMLIGAVAVGAISVPETVSLVPATMIAMAVGWSWPGVMLYAVVRVGRDAPGMASAFVQTGAFAGGAAGPLMFGLLIDLAGYTVTWWVAGTALLAASCLVVVARRDFIADLGARPPRVPLVCGVARLPG
jgi:predicted MFS family arabinose efflux permease